ncbi:uncharacterized protein LOC128955840 [Oppia nitens]|uniref:uncharacterized protein LOC128955840 n=1 Tax=Oppia nitens TaxID=1686743 RepID=UPI0023DBA1F1|nr:uncharacterized protein LOC128955840 [Oppia nitens]
MKLLIISSLMTICLLSLNADCKTHEVSNAGQLSSALSSAEPGDSVHLHDGSYHGSFVITRSGSQSAPITLTGSRQAVLSGTKYGLWLKADHWQLKGFTVANSPKGIVLERASHNLLDNLEVHNIKQEGIHLRTSSSDNTLQNSYVHHTGRGDTTDQGYGEGVYIGQAFHNWADGKQDKSDRNKILNNKIGPEVTAECLDIKEGSCCGHIKGNHFDGTGEKGIHYADSWVDVKGDSYVIEDNTGTHPKLNGFEIHHIDQAGMGGCKNTIKNNKCLQLPKGGKCAVSSSKKCQNDIQQ